MMPLHITDCDSGGVPEVIDTLLDKLPGQVLFTGQSPKLFRNRGRILAALGRPRSRNPIHLLKTLKLATAVVRHSQAGLLHGHSSFGGVYAAVIGQRLNRPLVYTPHATPAMIPNRGLGDRIISMAEVATCYSARSIIACSDDEAAVLARLTTARKIMVIPNGVVPPALDRGQEPLWDILFVGRIAHQKRPDLFARLAEQVCLQRPGTRIGWIGPGIALETEAVDWIGSLTEVEVASHLARTRIYASLSDYEGLSLAALRAATAGCDLALRNTIGNRSPVALGAAGFVFSNLEDGASEIVARLDDDHHWSCVEKIKRRDLATDMFSIERMIASTQALYEQAFAGYVGQRGIAISFNR